MFCKLRIPFKGKRLLLLAIFLVIFVCSVSASQHSWAQLKYVFSHWICREVISLNTNTWTVDYECKEGPTEG
jgi:hypothetical protein